MNLLKDSKTKECLMRAFAGESQARNRYTIGATQAKDDKLVLIERVFLYTADQEAQHAKIFYTHLKELAGQNIFIDGGYPVDIYSCLAQTLKAAQHNEYEEWESVYTSFAKIAREEGFMQVAYSFEAISKIEKTHGDRFGKFANYLETNTLFNSDVDEKWICLKCGHIHIGKSVPELCPVCQYPKGYFIRFAESPYEKL